jgi:hypothetical protein
LGISWKHSPAQALVAAVSLHQQILTSDFSGAYSVASDKVSRPPVGIARFLILATRTRGGSLPFDRSPTFAVGIYVAL